MFTTQEIHFRKPLLLDRTEYDGIEDFFVNWYQLQKHDGDHILYQANDDEVSDEILHMSKISLAKDLKYFSNI